jgi:hypothetical protein
MRREEESAMPLSRTQVEKDLGDIILGNNPFGGGNVVIQPAAGASTFKPPKGFTSWPALPSELDALGLRPPGTSPYQVQKAQVITYVNPGDVNPATGQLKLHQLWIIYGEGGE